MSDRPGQATKFRPIMKVKNVNKIYQTSKGEFAAIKDANLEVYEHEFVCLLGPSGCGKSTLLNIIAGLTEPSSGEIIFEEKPIHGPSPERGMVFQAYAAFPWMTVQQNIEFGPKMRGLSSQVRQKIVEKQIQLVGLTGFEHLYPKELSGGMNKRVDLARAYANDPKLLCMDEPFGALDAQTRQKMQLELLRIWSVEEKTVIFVTHDMEEAVLLADRIVVMQRNPNSIRRIINVKFPRPRGLEIKLERAFQELRLTLWEALEQ
jgi:NitT/TauT family transport system ATP-binding protein